jgi:hypothetical protein
MANFFERINKSFLITGHGENEAMRRTVDLFRAYKSQPRLAQEDATMLSHAGCLKVMMKRNGCPFKCKDDRLILVLRGATLTGTSTECKKTLMLLNEMVHHLQTSDTEPRRLLVLVDATVRSAINLPIDFFRFLGSHPQMASVHVCGVPESVVNLLRPLRSFFPDDTITLHSEKSDVREFLNDDAAAAFEESEESEASYEMDIVSYRTYQRSIFADGDTDFPWR